MAGPRTILHADMDAFYAAVEQRDRPELRGRPVIIGGHGPRQVVSTASYEARRFGVHSAMPGRRARQLCPDGVFVPPRMQHYADISAQIHEVFEQFTDEVEPLSLDEAFLDVTGSRALFGDGRTIAAQIKADVLERTNLRVSVGVDDDEPRLPTATNVWPTANFHEREVHDMFGVEFEGHPNLRRILMPDEWVGHPQRKDYPLGGIDVEYKGATIPPPDERRNYSS